MKQDSKYYERQIMGLRLILEDENSTMIARSYVEEQLVMMLNGGIGFHQSIIKVLDGDEE